MALFDENIQTQLKQIYAQLKDEVNIVYFKLDAGCPSCAETKQFLTEMAELTDKIKLEVLDYATNSEEAKTYAISRVPAIVMLDKNKKDYGIRFYGIPSGYEVNSFIASLMELSGVTEALPADILQQLAKVTKPIHIQVFATPTCPHCPGAVITAHKLAYNNPNITADAIEANSFPELSNKYNVTGVPKIVINETHELMGNQPITEFLKVITAI